MAKVVEKPSQTVDTSVAASPSHPTAASFETAPASAQPATAVEPNHPNGDVTSAPAVQAVSAPEPTKEQLKEQKAFEKVIQRDAKHEEKHLKNVTKDAAKSEKVEAKALKEQEKARKALEKAQKAEYKAKQKLTKAQASHNTAIEALNKAQGVLANKKQHHDDLVLDKQNKLKSLDTVRHEKAAHDQVRQEKLANGPASVPTSPVTNQSPRVNGAH